eukprot:2496353-Prorocentrum_lima.AAC.1
MVNTRHLFFTPSLAACPHDVAAAEVWMNSARVQRQGCGDFPISRSTRIGSQCTRAGGEGAQDSH